MSIKRIFLLIFLVVLGGCATIQSFELHKKQFVRDVNNGVLICSIIHDRYGLGRPTPSYYIRRIGESKRNMIYGYNSFAQSLFAISGEVNDNGPGVIKILELPAGNYEIFKWELFFNYGLSQWEESPKKEFSIPFEIKPDTINYIGQLALRDYKLICTDQSERDISKAYIRNSSLKGLNVYKQNLNIETEFEDVKESGHVTQTPPVIYK